MTRDDIQRVEDAYIAAVGRCKQIGFEWLELEEPHVLAPPVDQEGPRRVVRQTPGHQNQRNGVGGR